VFIPPFRYDETDGAVLHYVDYLANAKSVNYAAQGYGGMFSASIFDRYHHESKSSDGKI
jgi:20S proteasome subunit beta 4